MFLCQDLAFSLAWVQMKICNGSGFPKESLLRGAFSLEKIRTQGAAGRITCKFTITSERKTGPPQKTEESEPNECGRIPARRIFFGKDKECGSDNRITKFTITSNARRSFIEKHMESGRVSATHVLVEKRHGLRERLVACHMNYNHIERETRLT